MSSSSPLETRVQQETEKAELSLKVAFNRLLDRNAASRQEIEGVFTEQQQVLHQSLQPLRDYATGIPEMQNRIQQLEQAISNRFNVIKERLMTVLDFLEVQEQDDVLLRQYEERFKNFLNKVIDDLPDGQIPSSQAPAVNPVQNQTPQTNANQARVENVQPQEAAPEVAPPTPPTVKELNRVWLDFPKQYTGNGLETMDKEFVRAVFYPIYESFKNGLQHKGFSGKEGARLFIKDKMGGFDDYNQIKTNSEFSQMLERAHDAFKSFVEAEREDGNNRDLRQFRIDFFDSGMSIDEHGQWSHTNQDIDQYFATQRQTAQQQRDAQATQRAAEQPTPQPPPTPQARPAQTPQQNEGQAAPAEQNTTPAINVDDITENRGYAEAEEISIKEQAENLASRGVSRTRLTRFLDRHLDATDAIARLQEASNTPGNQEVYLDQYEEGLARRFAIDSFRKLHITPQTWLQLPQVYENLRNQFQNGRIDESVFTQAIRNFGTDKYPRITIGFEAGNFFIERPGGTRTRIDNAQNNLSQIDASDIRALKLILSTSQLNNLNDIFKLSQKTYLELGKELKENAEFFSIPVNENFLEDAFEIDGNSIKAKEFDWNGTETLPGQTPDYTWKQKLLNGLAAFKISLDEVRNGVSIEQVYDHAAQFTALIESRSFQPYQSQTPRILEYNIGGVKMTYDKGKDNTAALHNYLTEATSGFTPFPEKVSFIEHLLQISEQHDLDISPMMLLELFKEDFKPVDFGSGANFFRPDPFLIDSFSSFIGIIKNNDDYFLKVRGEIKENIPINRNLAEGYFSLCKDRTIANIDTSN